MNTCITSWWSPIYNIYILCCFFFFFSFFYFFLFCTSTLNVSLSTYLYKIMFCYLYIKINYQQKRERIIYLCKENVKKWSIFFKKKLLILCYKTVAFHSLPFRSPFNFSMNLMSWAHVSFLRGVGFYFHLAKPEQTF